MTDPGCGQSRQREQSFIYSLIQFQKRIKLAQGLGVATDKNYNDEWEPLPIRGWQSIKRRITWWAMRKNGETKGELI